MILMMWSKKSEYTIPFMSWLQWSTIMYVQSKRWRVTWKMTKADLLWRCDCSSLTFIEWLEWGWHNKHTSDSHREGGAAVHLPRVVQHDRGQVLTGLGEVSHGQAEGGQKATLRADTGQSGYLSGEERASALDSLLSPGEKQWGAHTPTHPPPSISMHRNWSIPGRHITDSRAMDATQTQAPAKPSRAPGASTRPDWRS